MMETTYDTVAVDQSAWSGPRLLVPVTLQALVVNGSYMQDAEWSIAPNNYKNLANFQIPVEPPPFTLQRLFQPTASDDFQAHAIPDWTLPKDLTDGTEASASSPPSSAPGIPWTGVILHWTLPNALTHGTQAGTDSPPSNTLSSPVDGSDIQYPVIPNRWLVLRTSPNPDPENLCDGQARCTMGWVIQSDLLDQDNNAGTQQFHEFIDPATGNQATIGTSSPLADWLPQWQASAASYPLQAVGPGNSSYVAYTANLFNVISFQDTLSDLPSSFSSPLGYLPLTYMVFGWYSDPTADPLAGATADNWQDLMTSLQWSVDNGDVYPEQILCHAMVYDVKWYGAAADVTQSGVPGMESPLGELPLVAVGNTAVEALAALIEQQICAEEKSPYCPDGENVAELMEAFQYNLIQLWDQPSGQAQIDKQTFQAQFGSTKGGTIWQVVRPTSIEQASPPNPASPPAANSGALPPPPLTPQEAALLEQLNRLQTELDRQQRLLDSLQYELYALWWKYNYCQYYDGSPPDNIPLIYITQWQQAVENTQGEINSLINGDGSSAGIESTQAELRQLLGGSLQLVSVANQRFWQPNDPVVLVGGAKGSFKHRPDSRFSDDDTLPCRITGQTISTITVTARTHPSQATVAGAALNPDLPTGGSAIPSELADLFNNITALYGEALLLDTDEAMPIANLAVQNLNPPDSSITAAILALIISAQQTSLWNSAVYPAINSGATAAASGFDGTPPYPISVMPWSPPWSPLYMDWSVQWIPSYTWDVDSPSYPTTALDGWTFDEMDYEWTGSVNTGVTYPLIQGRTMLTPQVTDTFAARLEQYLHLNCAQADGGAECLPSGSPPQQTDFPDSYSPPPEVAEALGEALQMIRQWDILSQTMTGFHQQLIMRDPSQHIPCSSLTDGLQPPVWPLIGTGDEAIPLPQSLTGFNPIRAGHFIFQRLWIVDDFGQVFDVGEAMNNKAGGPFFPTAVSQSLVAPNNPTLMQLPPRIVQPSRLAFTLVSAEDDAQDTAFLPEANPICGWVLPNHLDASLFIFDTNGFALGEMQLVGGRLNQRARWNPMPDTPAPVGAPPGILNAHLRGFVEGILNKPDGGGAALSSLLDAVDETLWTVDPLGGRSNQSLSVLIGRPLALTRARLMFELAGDPVYDQSWANTGQQVTADFTEVNFTVRLGDLQLADEGLLGYFMADDYQQFNSVRLPEKSSSPYIAQQDIQLQLNTDLSSPPELSGMASPPGESLVYITMLVDPRGTMHAGTGILPIESLTIPGEYVEPALAQMEVTFRTGPLLTATEQLQMPLPANTQGNWSWVQQPSVTTWQEITTIAKANPSAKLSDIPVSIREGWLKLTGALAGDDETK